MNINSSTKGSLPAKLDIIGEEGLIIGKLFIEYEILKTEVTYAVEKIIDYNYLLKLSNFKVNFLRDLKKVPSFYLKLTYGNNKPIREEFAFTQENKNFFYKYPIKLNIKE